MFWKYAFVLLLNTFLGPGIGQLILKQFKKGAVILGAAFVLLIIMSFILISSVDVNTMSIPTDFAAMKDFVSELMTENADKIKYPNYALLILWIYSSMDIIMSAFDERKKIKNEEPEEKQ